MSNSSSGSGMGDILGLFGQGNPVAQFTKSFGQFQKGLDDFLRLVEQFGTTMEQMGRIATRVNTLLDDVEPPVRALMPQVTRTIKAGDVIVDRMGSAVDLLGDLAKGMQPLAQLAENATGLLGLKNLGSLRNASPGDLMRRATQLATFADLGGGAAEPAPASSSASARATVTRQPTTNAASAKKAPARKAPAKASAPAKKAPAKKAPAKKAPAKASAPAKKSGGSSTAKGAARRG